MHGLCRALAGLGHEVHVFTTSVDGTGDSPVPHGVPIDLDGVKIWYFRSPLLRRLYWAPGMRKALAGKVSSFDVVHLHSIFLWPTWAAAREARKRNVPYVLSPRGMLEKDLVRRRSRLVKSAWLALIERRNLEGAALVHFTSEREREEAARFGYRFRAVAIEPNGVELPGDDQARSLAEPIDAATGPSPEIAAAMRQPLPYFLFLSRISWKKGLDRLVDALALVPSVRLVVAGNDDEGYWPRVWAIAEAKGIAGRIVRVGEIGAADKAALFGGALALVLPSYSENFGNVVLEAMAAGCPVVVTPEVGAAEVVQRAGAGLVVEGNPEKLGGALRALAGDRDIRAAMGIRGQAAAAELSWSNVARAMAAMYGAVLGSKR